MKPSAVQAISIPLGRPTIVLAPAVPALPGFHLECRLSPHRLGARWLARQGGAVFLACHIERPPAGLTPDDAEEALRRLCRFSHPHSAGVSDIRRDGRAGIWIISPHCGAREGPLTLARLLAAKPGAEFDELEAVFAVRSLLEALSAARAFGAPHGLLRLDEVLVHRHGRLLIDLLGVERALTRQAPDGPSEARAEARAVAAIACELLTGVPPLDAPALTPIRTLGRAWAQWLTRGLEPEPGGFSSVEEALAATPDPLNPSRRRRPRIFGR